MVGVDAFTPQFGNFMPESFIRSACLVGRHPFEAHKLITNNLRQDHVMPLIHLLKFSQIGHVKSNGSARHNTPEEAIRVRGGIQIRGHACAVD